MKKGIHPEKISYIPRKMGLSSTNIKKFLSFSCEKAVFIFQETKTPKEFLTCSQEKAFLIFQETETAKRKLFLYFGKRKPLKKILMLQETEPSYFSGNGNSKKLYIFQGLTFFTRKMTKTHSEKTSYISGGTSKAPKTKISPKKVMNKIF